jgi:predicted dehydrogenase
VVAIAEIRPKLADAVAKKYGMARIYTGHRQLLSDPDVQAVICIQPFHSNYPLARQVLEAGRSLLTEKPMVTWLDDGEALVALARR